MMVWPLASIDVQWYDIYLLRTGEEMWMWPLVSIDGV